MGFAFFGDALEYLLIGALIVVPIFLLMRLLKLGGAAAAAGVTAAGLPPVRPFAVTHGTVFRLAVPMTLAYLSLPLVGSSTPPRSASSARRR